MTENKPKSIYVMHGSSFVDHPSIDAVILVNDDVDVLNDLITKYRHKVRHVHFRGPLEKVGDIYPGFKGLIKTFPKTKEEIIKASGVLKKRKCLLCPQFPIKKVEDISLIASMGIPVDLLYRIDTLEKTVIMDILEYYLHHRSLEVPIEPFHTILLSKLKKDKLHLWDLHMIFPHRYFYVDDKGIADSPTSLRKKKYLFHIDSQSGEWLKTGKKDTLDAYLKNIPENRPDCLSCPHFHWCFTWALYKKDTCDTWKTILDHLQKAAREVEELKKEKNETTKDTEDTKKKKEKRKVNKRVKQ